VCARADWRGLPGVCHEPRHGLVKLARLLEDGANRAGSLEPFVGRARAEEGDRQGGRLFAEARGDERPIFVAELQVDQRARRSVCVYAGDGPAAIRLNHVEPCRGEFARYGGAGDGRIIGNQGSGVQASSASPQERRRAYTVLREAC
jgi:hypothetical protein